MPPTNIRKEQIFDVNEDDLVLTDVTTNDASVSKHGFLKKLANDAAKFLNGLGNWVSLAISDITNLQTTLDAKAGVGTTIAGIPLASGSWSLVSGLYEYTYSNASILSGSIVSVIPDNSTIDIVTAAQILPYVLVSSGSIKLYAKNAPSNTISINVVIGA